MDGEERELEAIRHAELVKNIREVVLDRFHADRKLRGDIVVRVSRHDGRHHLDLARGEAKG